MLQLVESHDAACLFAARGDHGGVVSDRALVEEATHLIGGIRNHGRQFFSGVTDLDGGHTVAERLGLRMRHEVDDKAVELDGVGGCRFLNFTKGGQCAEVGNLTGDGWGVKRGNLRGGHGVCGLVVMSVF